MSVRDGHRAVWSLGDGHGLRLHSELATRAAHRRTVNLGQTYSTPERLARAGIVEPAEITPDGLPLCSLIDSGREAAAEWMTEPVRVSLPEWTEMPDQALVSSSIDPGRPQASPGDLTVGGMPSRRPRPVRLVSPTVEVPAGARTTSESVSYFACP